MKKIVGHIHIDSGRCWIGDPCYVLPDGAMDNPGRDWSSFYDLTCKSAKPGEPITQTFDGVGVCVGTGYGDGSYPVTAQIKNGRVMSITVDFSGEEEEDE